MKSCILKRIDEVQRRKLSENGVIFYDWNQDIVVGQDQMPLVLELLDAQAEETNTDFQDMVEVVLKTRAVVKVGKMKEPIKDSAAPAVKLRDPATERARAAYIKASKQRLKSQLDSAQSSLDELQKRMPGLGAKYAELSRKDFLAATSADLDVRRTLSTQEYRRLRAVPDVAAVRVINGSILIHTVGLHATAPDGEVRDIGSFLIVIDTGSSASPIRWHNQTRQVDAWKPSMQAPYVLQDGSPIATDMQETFIQLIAQLEFCVVAELAIQFIQTVNSDEAGKYLNCWPAVQKQDARHLSTSNSKRSDK